MKKLALTISQAEPTPPKSAVFLQGFRFFAEVQQ